MANQEIPESTWTFLTNHSHVLLCLYRNSVMRIRDIALEVGITERAVQKIISDLDASGYIHKEKVGRHNEYNINMKAQLRHPIEAHRTIGDLIELLER